MRLLLDKHIPSKEEDSTLFIEAADIKARNQHNFNGNEPACVYLLRGYVLPKEQQAFP